MHAWKQLRGEMVATDGRDFLSLIASLLSIIWRDMVLTPPAGQLEQAGVDLVAGSSGDHFSFAVQCRSAAGAGDLSQQDCESILARIDAFIASPFTCDEYVVFHNRDGRKQDVTAAIGDGLSRLQAAGKATRTTLWDPQIFGREFEGTLRADLRKRLEAQSERFLSGAVRLFDFGSVYVPAVPLSEHRLLLNRGELPSFTPVSGAALREPAKLISSPSQVRWTLLMGLFGTGKSSAALRAARHTNQLVIYVRCADMHARAGGTGTNALMETIIRSLDLYEEYDEATRGRLNRLCGSHLRAELVGDDTNAILILDGLDENRQYSTARGVMTLSSVLAELQCPILLTTRAEHFNATFGNYGELLVDHSLKGRARREARVFRLEPWQDEQVDEFLMLALERSDGSNDTLTRLRERLTTKQIATRELELLRHPLFLQMIVELAANGEESGSTAAEVLGKWTFLKMRRDMEVDRVLPSEVNNLTDYLEAMGTALEDVAGVMVEQRDGEIVLTESVSEAEVVAAVSRAFDGKPQDIVTVTGASLLVPNGPKLGRGAKLSFSLRIFQEYYLSRFLVRTDAAVDAFPADVQRLVEELRRNA